MTPESRVATRMQIGLGAARGRYHDRGAFVGIVVHTTGAGVVGRWRREGERHNEVTPFETALRVYQTIMPDGPHYVIGQAGECVQVCPEHLAAWHVGSSLAGAYRSMGWDAETRHRWWLRRWPDLCSPLDLAGGHLWDHGSCNDNVLGIEVVPPVDDPRGPWSESAWVTLGKLLRDVSERRLIPFAREYIVTHSDAHPLARTTPAGEPYDPGPRQWGGWDTVAQHLGAPLMCGPGV